MSKIGIALTGQVNEDNVGDTTRAAHLLHKSTSVEVAVQVPVIVNVIPLKEGDEVILA